MGASATIQISGGSITGATVVSGGGGYSPLNIPIIVISDSTGSGGLLVSEVNSVGVITGFIVVDAGADYTAPTMAITAAKNKIINRDPLNQAPTVDQLDPNSLISKASVRQAVTGIPDSFEGEITTLEQIASTPIPFPDPAMKLDTVESYRGSSDIAELNMTFANTNSADRVNYPHTKIQLDSTSLTSQGTQSKIVDATSTAYADLETVAEAELGTPPSVPDPNMSLGSVLVERLTDGKLQVIDNWTPYTTQWLLENEPTLFKINKGSSQWYSPLGFGQNSTASKVQPKANAYAAPASLTGGLLQEVKSHLVHPNFAIWSSFYGNVNAVSEELDRRTKQWVDPQSLGSQQEIATMNGGAVAPGGVADVRLLTSGSDYTSPTVTITGTPTPSPTPTATAIVLNGAIVAIEVTAASSGMTSATVAITDATGTGATAEVLLAPSNLVLEETLQARIDPNNVVTTNIYAQNNSVTKIQNRETYADAGFLPESSTSANVTIAACLPTDSMPALAFARGTLLAGTVVNNQPFYKSRAIRQNPTQVKYIDLYKYKPWRAIDPAGHIEIDGRSGITKSQDYVTYSPILSNSTTTTATVMVKKSFKIGTSYYVELTPMTVRESFRVIHVKKIVNASSPPDNLAYVGYVNSAVIMGMAPSTVQFMGATYKEILNTATPQFLMDWEFLYKFFGHNAINIGPFLVMTAAPVLGPNTLATITLATGAVSVASPFTAAQVQQITPSQVDFTTWAAFT